MKTKIFYFFVMVICLISLKSFGYPDEIQFSGSISGSAQSIYSTPNDRFILGISDTSSSISVFDALLFEQVSSYSAANTPYDMYLSGDGLKAYLVTNRTDTIVVLDISDPENIFESTSYDLSTSSVTFRKIEGVSVSGDLYLFVTDPSNNRIYVYNATAGLLADSVNNPINLSFSPVDIDISPDGATISALGEDGDFQVFSTSDFSQITTLIDVVSGDADFVKLEQATVSLGEVAFLLNSNSTGEIYLISMVDKLNDNIGIIDADPTAGGSGDPIVVGNGASEIALVSVANPDSIYLYSSSPGESALKVTDTADIGDGSTKIEPLATISSSGNVTTGGIAGSSQDGYLYSLSSNEQKINILSENPIVTLVSPTGTTSLDTGSLTVTFKPDTSGTYSLTNYTGSAQDSVSSSVGTTLKSGSHTADEEVSHEVSVNELAQGDNIISFFAVAGSFTGRKAVKIIYDTVPAMPANFKVEFGNQKLICSWERSGESDIDYYNLYFGTSSGDLSGADGIASPIQIDQTDSGSSLSYTIEPLTNGVEIFLQLSAVDEGGNESERTAIISDIPEQTIGPLGLSGERGCGVTSPSSHLSIFILLIIFLLVLLLSKRFKSIFLVFLLFLFVSFPSFAQEDDGNSEQITLTTPVEEEIPRDMEAPTSLTTSIKDPHKPKIKDFMSGSFQISWFMPTNQILRNFYGLKGNETYTLKNTYFIWLFEVGLEVGFFWEGARMIGETTGRQSGERAKMFMLPVSVPIIFNIRVLDNQMLVPYMKFGYSFLYYRISEPTDSINGVTNRMLAGGGLKFNFEEFTGEGMSVDVGINHMFLFFEWLYYHNFKSGGLTFSGNNWGFGVGVDY